MRVLYSSVCPRCGVRTSASGTSEEVSRVIASLHICADGTPTPSGPVKLERVPGPGERTKLPEERM